MGYQYHVGVFTLHGEYEWARATPTNHYERETLGQWLGDLTNTRRAVEVVSITETPDRLTAIVRTLTADVDASADAEPMDPKLFEPMR